MPARLPGSDHWRHHSRFYASVAFGIAVWLATHPLAPPVRTAIAGNSFFLLYLLFTWRVGRRLTPDDLRRRAALDDEGIALIALITLAAISLSLGSLVLLLDETPSDPFHMVLAIATVPLGWLTFHTIMAFHYTKLFYARPDTPTADRRQVGGLAFPGDEQEPTVIDFLYFSFVVGMTAQVSDVQVCSRAMRRATLVHGIVSFFFNTVIVALAVNLAVARH